VQVLRQAGMPDGATAPGDGRRGATLAHALENVLGKVPANVLENVLHSVLENTGALWYYCGLSGRHQGAP
jgi:hypothetical protein